MKEIRRFEGEWGFLSNFAEVPGGLTVEHRYQAAKTTDPDERAAILAAATPGKAKRLGGKCRLRPDWPDGQEAEIFSGVIGVSIIFQSGIRACAPMERS